MSDAKPSYDPNWTARFAHAVADAAEAVRRIRPGQRVFVGTGCGEPRTLVRALTDRAGELADIELVHLLTFGEAPYARPELADIFHVNSFFLAENVRGVVQQGLGDYTPIFLSDIPRLFASGALPLDAALIQVSPPDDRGVCSLGVSVDVVRSAAENAALVIAEVNPRMPRTLGDAFIHADEIDLLVPVDEPLLEFRPPEPDEATARIGENVASLVEDGSTVELGIGRIPHTTLAHLKGKRDLGVHTEMFTDGLIDLIESGAVTGARKTLDRGKVVASFCLGTQRLYDYIDGNPLFAFCPTEYVNDPALIARQERMVAINVALEVDLTGQVCADSLGTRFFSGIGGQVDFNRGAARSPGGKAIIALPSTAKDGKVSRIVARLSSGAGVVTTRGDVHYVVTEHGVAYVHGKSVQERALALIGVAHPDFREELLHGAIEAKYLRPDMAEVAGRIGAGPRELRASLLLDDGTLLSFRPVHPTDEPRMRDLYYALSRESLYFRFMGYMKRIPRRQLHDFVYVDHRHAVAVVGTLPAAQGEEIVAVGSYYVEPKTNRAEVAFTVRDDFHRRGIGRFLLGHLMTIARRGGLAGFTAEVLADNVGMRAVFAGADCKVRSSVRAGVVRYDLDFV